MTLVKATDAEPNPRCSPTRYASTVEELGELVSTSPDFRTALMLTASALQQVAEQYGWEPRGVTIHGHGHVTIGPILDMACEALEPKAQQ